MPTLWDDETSEPARTHALVIGVGQYLHLEGGGAERSDFDFGLRQLTSPPISARAFADWLFTHYNNPDAPLGSVELLLSEPVAVDYTFPAKTRVDLQAGTAPVDPATLHSVEEAGQRWKGRCDGSSQNVAVFYFCGHGIAVQGDRLLLLADYGKDADNPFAQAINFDRTFRGMARSHANLQCYFVDACRQVPIEGLEMEGPAGYTPVHPRQRGNRDRDALWLHAAAPEDTAHATTNEVSRFTRALLLALDGLGSRRSNGAWRVRTSLLGEAVNRLVARLNRLDGGPPQYSRFGGEGEGRRTLHLPQATPVIPVDLNFNPAGAVSEAVLSLESQRQQRRHERDPNSFNWRPDDIQAGVYRLSAQFRLGTYRDYHEPEFVVDTPLVEETLEVGS